MLVTPGCARERQTMTNGHHPMKVLTGFHPTVDDGLWSDHVIGGLIIYLEHLALTQLFVE